MVIMDNHTQGPWTLRLSAGVPGVIIGGVVREYTNGSGQDQLFMVCTVQPENGGDAAMLANARLATAAPELLTALRLTVAALNGRPCRQQALDDAYRAINNATIAETAYAPTAPAIPRCLLSDKQLERLSHVPYVVEGDMLRAMAKELLARRQVANNGACSVPHE